MSDVTTIEADVPERYADAVQARLQQADDGSPDPGAGSIGELTDGLGFTHHLCSHGLPAVRIHVKDLKEL